MNNFSEISFDKTDLKNTLKKDLSNLEQLKTFGNDFSKLFKVELRILLKNKSLWILGFILPVVSIVLVGLVLALSQDSVSSVIGFNYYGSPDIPLASFVIPLTAISFIAMPSITMTFRKTNHLKRLGNIGIQKFNYYLTYMLIGFVAVIFINLILFGPVTILSIWSMAKAFDTTTTLKIYENIDYAMFIPYYLLTAIMFLSIGYYISMKFKSSGAVTSVAVYFLIVFMFFGGFVTLFAYDDAGDKVYIARIMQTLTIVIPFLVFNNILMLATESHYYAGYENVYYIEYAISMAFALFLIITLFIGNKKYFNYSFRG